MQEHARYRPQVAARCGLRREHYHRRYGTISHRCERCFHRAARSDRRGGIELNWLCQKLPLLPHEAEGWNIMPDTLSLIIWLVAGIAGGNAVDDLLKWGYGLGPFKNTV